jgi:hypothetical protein
MSLAEPAQPSGLMLSCIPRRGQVHETEPRIFLVHNRDFSRGGTGAAPGAAAVAALSWPARTGWHSDQSYRRPPPDASLLYCVAPAAEGQVTLVPGPWVASTG